MRIVIVGAGIGGLATAVALRRVGLEPIVLERAPILHELGAGLSLWSNALRALRALCAESQVLAASSVVDRMETRRPDGRLIATTHLTSLVTEPGPAAVCIHRADLQQILFSLLPEGTVRSGAACLGRDGATALLAGGERIAGDVLIGADGLSSVIRATLHGSVPPRYAGYTCWRGICAHPADIPPQAALFVTARGSQFGAWPCRPGQLYWFLTRNAPPGTHPTKADALQFCAAWASPVPQIIEATPEASVLQNDILDRPPLPAWTRGPVTLLGDAAHPSTPNLGQGACQALEDAVVLADCLRRHAPADALAMYERLRRPRTTMVVKNSWQAGRLLQTEQPTLAALRDWFSGSRLGARLQQRMFRDLLDWHPPQL